MKVVYIMRGIPGSGKSTVAEQLAGKDGVIHSTDSYFCKSGEYKYNPKQLWIYHQCNLRAFTKSVEKGIPVVICDNTNPRHADYRLYAKVAKEHGYIVAIVTLPHPDLKVAAKRNKHDVPLEKLEKIVKSWEP